jgi:hypothetical protein
MTFLKVSMEAREERKRKRSGSTNDAAQKSRTSSPAASQASRKKKQKRSSGRPRGRPRKGLPQKGNSSKHSDIARRLNTPEAIAKRAQTYSQNTIRNANMDRLRRRPRPASSDDDIATPVTRKRSKVAPQEDALGRSTTELIFEELGEEETAALLPWIEANLKPKGKPNLTARQLAKHIQAKVDISITESDARDILNHFGFRWTKYKSGFYRRKMHDPDVIAHRDKVIPLLAWFLDRPDLFDVFYQDETAVRKFHGQTWGWARPDVEDDVYDERQHPGAGDGFNITAYIRKNGLVFNLDNDVETLAGSVNDSAKNKKGKSGKETAETFLETCRQTFQNVVSQNVDSGRMGVLVIDGAAVHRTMSPESWNPNKMNLLKVTDKAPITLRAKFEELNMDWRGVPVYEARQMLLNTPAFKSQRMAIETLAEEFNCLVILIPNSHPHLNPIEYLWRYLKAHTRALNNAGKAALGEKIDEVLVSENIVELAPKLFSKARGYMEYFNMHFGQPVTAPTERVIRRMQRNNELERINVKYWDEMFGDAECGDEIDFERLEECVHSVNVMRMRAKRERK